MTDPPFFFAKTSLWSDLASVRELCGTLLLENATIFFSPH